ncbi:MAG: restriction endonuclease subunit S [Veillonella sp.]|uniref:restriction endonuclease subunit S n=1 Tax=Veillonella sp. TaxID=1926307 RepID=UPI0029041E9E|nr:restriction endonuclease subunit S [Veillonella sp.]MDU1938869.1 restriction endonuclease subunit S [Veillonella sp.]
MNYVRLGDLCVINSGGTPRRNNESYWKNGDIPWVKISDLKNGIVESTEEFITLDGLNNSSAKIFPKGTLLYTIFATIGEVAILKMDAATNQAIVGIQLKENKKVYLKYIYYYLKSQTNNIKQLGRGVAQNNINLSVVKNMIIPIVSLEKQRNIIATLNKLEKIKENRITILNCLDDLIKSRFDELFLDTHAIEIIEIGELFEVGSSKRILQSELTAYGVPFYRVTDLINRINDKTVDIKQYVDEFKYMTLIKDKYVPQAGDFLITARGTIGKIYEVKQNDRFYFQDGMITWLKRKNNYINSLFFMELVKTDWFRRQFYSSNNGTTISYLSITDTRHLKVLLPSINLQKQFAQEVNQINKLKFA